MGSGYTKNPRTCVACRMEKQPKEMLRVVKTPEGEIIIDEFNSTSKKANGRGAYICNNHACFVVASKKRLLDKALRVSVPEDVYAKLEGFIEPASEICVKEVVESENAVRFKSELGSLLGLARRSKEIVIGQDNVLEALKRDVNLTVLVSNDCAVKLKDKVRAKVLRFHVLKNFSKLELGACLGLRQTQIVAFHRNSSFVEKVESLLLKGEDLFE